MLIMLRQDSGIRRDVGEGGGGAALAEADVGAEAAGGEEIIEEVIEEEAPDAGGEPSETLDGSGGGTKPAGDGKGTLDDATPASRAFAAMRSENTTLKKRLEAIEGKLTGHDTELGRLRPPEKDAITGYFEGKKPLTEGQKDALDAWAEAGSTEEAKQDRQLLAAQMRDPGFRRALLEPLFTDNAFRQALLAPILAPLQAMFRSLDLNSWQVEQMVEAFKEIGGMEIDEAEVDDAGNVVKPAETLSERYPVGMKHRSRILEHHQGMVQKQNGRWVPIRSAFDEIQAQLTAETKAAATAGGKAARAATERTLKEVQQRRTAAGSPRSEAAPARGGSVRAGKRTFDQIESSATDFRIP